MLLSVSSVVGEAIEGDCGDCGEPCPGGDSVLDGGGDCAVTLSACDSGIPVARVYMI